MSESLQPHGLNMPGLPVHHQLPELTQTHDHWVNDTNQSSHPLSSPSPLAFNLSKHQSLLKWVSSLHQVSNILEFQLQHQSFQWTFRTVFIYLSIYFYFRFPPPFIFISWRLITLQYCSGFAIHWHESAMDIHVFPTPIPSPTSLSTRSFWVFPVHQVRTLVSCIQPGLVICFTLDNIHVSMLFSWNIPPSPSPTESRSLFYTSVSLFLFCI